MEFTVTKFEQLKKRANAISLAKAKEEARLDSINKDIASLKETLSEYGVSSEEEATVLLNKLTTELDDKLSAMEQALREYDEAMETEHV